MSSGYGPSSCLEGMWKIMETIVIAGLRAED
jgi:hypothetical protein